MHAIKTIVTGGAGFIGSAVVRELVRSGAQVLVIDKLTYAGNLSSLESVRSDSGFHFTRLDICDGERVLAAITEFRPTHILHLAAESHVDRSIMGAKDFIETNIVGTFSMLESARAYWTKLAPAERDAFRFLHVSTDEVYGSLGDDGFFTETTPYDPSSPYSSSKAAADHLAMAWHRTYGLPTIVSNCSNNYGPYHFPEKLIPLTILNAMEGKRLPVYGTGSNIRDWLYVEDHARALLTVATRGRPGQKYNVGGKAEQRNIDVVRAICGCLDRLRPQPEPHERLIEFVADRPGHDQRYAIDAAKIEAELGWQPRESFESGLEQTVSWFLDNEWWWRPLRKDVYGGQRLGVIAG